MQIYSIRLGLVTSCIASRGKSNAGGHDDYEDHEVQNDDDDVSKANEGITGETFDSTIINTIVRGDDYDGYGYGSNSECEVSEDETHTGSSEEPISRHIAHFYSLITRQGNYTGYSCHFQIAYDSRGVTGLKTSYSTHVDTLGCLLESWGRPSQVWLILSVAVKKLASLAQK